MIMSDNQMLYSNASEELRKANYCQNEINNKKVNIQLVDIDIKYSMSYDSNRIQKMNSKSALQSEISKLESRRDISLNNAILYSLELAEQEISNAKNLMISMAYMSINSINSFIISYNIHLNVAIDVRMKLSSVSYKLTMMSNLALMNLNNEIIRLKTLCNVY